MEMFVRPIYELDRRFRDVFVIGLRGVGAQMEFIDQRNEKLVLLVDMMVAKLQRLIPVQHRTLIPAFVQCKNTDNILQKSRVK